MTTSKTLPIPLPGSQIEYNPLSLQLLQSGQYGVRIKFNARSGKWVMLTAPQHGGKHGGMLVVINDPEPALNPGYKPNVLVVGKTMVGGTGVFGDLHYNKDLPHVEPASRTGAPAAHSTEVMSDAALHQAAYDSQQQALKNDPLAGGNPIHSKQVRRESRVGLTGRPRKKTAKGTP